MRSQFGALTRREPFSSASILTRAERWRSISFGFGLLGFVLALGFLLTLAVKPIPFPIHAEAYPGKHSPVVVNPAPLPILLWLGLTCALVCNLANLALHRLQLRYRTVVGFAADGQDPGNQNTLRPAANIVLLTAGVSFLAWWALRDPPFLVLQTNPIPRYMLRPYAFERVVLTDGLLLVAAAFLIAGGLMRARANRKPAAETT